MITRKPRRVAGSKDNRPRRVAGSKDSKPQRRAKDLAYKKKMALARRIFCHSRLHRVSKRRFE